MEGGTGQGDRGPSMKENGQGDKHPLFKGTGQEGGSTLNRVGTRDPQGGYPTSSFCPLHGTSPTPPLWRVLSPLPCPLRGGMPTPLTIPLHKDDSLPPALSLYAESLASTPWKVPPLSCPVSSKGNPYSPDHSFPWRIPFPLHILNFPSKGDYLYLCPFTAMECPFSPLSYPSMSILWDMGSLSPPLLLGG